MRAVTIPIPKCRKSTTDRSSLLFSLIVFWLTLVVLATAVITVKFQWGLSLLWGVTVSALPGLCFAWYGYPKRVGAHQAAASLRAVYRAEKIKFVVTAVLFAAVFRWVEQIYVSAFFLAYLITHLGSSLVVARCLARPKT